jgi:putative membrane protein
MKASSSILIFALACASSAVLADELTATPTTFVKKAAQDGMTEVELGKVALAKTQSEAVRSFARRMVADHSKANAELTALAKTKGIEAPKALDAEHQAMVNTLKAKSGAEFDAEYSHHMAMDHSKAIALFEDAARSSDADLAQFAKKTLPTLKEHKQIADNLPDAKAKSKDM